MDSSLLTRIKKYLKKHKKQKIWKRTVLALAIMVVFITTYMLILPAITMSKKPICGKEEHTHTEKCYKEKPIEKLLCMDHLKIHQHTKDCYDKDNNLICGKADFVLHQHNKDCYNSEGKLICPLPEEKGHQHTESCYDKDGNLICGQEESYQPHQHTKDCYKDKDGKETTQLQCGKLEVEEHIHTKECFPEPEKELVCGKEEHQHTEECYNKEDNKEDNKEVDSSTSSTEESDEKTNKIANEEQIQAIAKKGDEYCIVQKLNIIQGKANIVQKSNKSKKIKKTKAKKVKESTGNSNEERLNFGDYLTGATISKLENGQWKESTEFTEGDQVRLNLQYQLPAGKVPDHQTIIYYQLPSGIQLSKKETGIVYQGVRNVGTYIIDTNGLIEIRFNKEFANGDAFSGEIQFEGTLSRDGVGEDGKIKFGGDAGSITVKKQKEEYDINTKKTATLKEDGKTIEYSVTVSTKNGTEGNVTIKDAFQNGNATGTYNKDSFKIYKIDANGNKTEVNGYTPSITTENSAQKFEISNLPALKAGEQYVVSYTAEAETTGKDGAGTLANSAGAQSGNHNDWAWNSVEISKSMIFKDGYYDQNTGLIQWKVTVNQSKKDISGYKFTDTLPEDMVGDAIIKDSSGKEIGKISANQKDLSYTFGEGSKDTYTIEYQTKAPDGNSNVKNTANIGKDGKDYNSEKEIGVNHRSWNLSKQWNGEETKNDKHYYHWQSIITLPNGAMGTFQYTDTIKQATTEGGTSTPTENSHYAIASELQKQIEDKIKITLKINDKDTECGYNNDYVSFQVKYYDKDGKEIQASDTTSKVQKFTVDVIPKDGHKDIVGTKMQLDYSTIVNIEAMNTGDTWKFKNESFIPNHTVTADHSYTRPKVFDKQIGIKDGNNISYHDGSAKIDYDASEGILYYRLLLRTQKNEDGEITVTDTLPDGATLVADSVKGHFYGNDYWSTDQWGNYNFNGNNKVTYSQDGQKVTMKIAKGYNSCGQLNGDSEDGNIISITYAVSVKNDPYWQDKTKDNKVYSNNAQWNNNHIEQNTTVNRQIDNIEKSVQQLKDSDGKATNVVEYKVLINPGGKDLLPNGDVLTLTDTLSVPNGVDAYLDLTNVKLYFYDESQQNNLGKEIDSSRYQMSYDQTSHKMTLKLPDELSCMLVYRYTIDAGNHDQPQLSNMVNLIGEYEKKTDAKLEKTTSSSIVRKGKLTIYKVDSENNKKLLPGAKFQLEYWDGSKWKTQVQQLVTDSNGQIELNAEHDGEDALEPYRLYRMTETMPPSGYSKAEQPYYFIFKAKENGKILENNEAFNKAQASSSGIDQSKILFFGADGGSLYVPNDYTKVSVKKFWVDQEGKTTSPTEKNVKVQLYRQKTKVDGYTLTVNVKGNGSLFKSTSTIVNKNSSATIIVPAWNQKYTVEYDGKKESANSDGKAEMTYVIPSVTKDTTVTITCTSGDYFENPTIKSATASSYTPVGNKEKVGDVKELNSSNQWTASWDNLDKKDAEGKPYFYTVEEVDVASGIQVTYVNNDGISSGEISITNKVASYVLPETGGSGTKWYIAAGVLFIAAAFIVIFYKRKYQGMRED